jgi:hypothetical protein
MPYSLSSNRHLFPHTITKVLSNEARITAMKHQQCVDAQDSDGGQRCKSIGILLLIDRPGGVTAVALVNHLLHADRVPRWLVCSKRESVV